VSAFVKYLGLFEGVLRGKFRAKREMTDGNRNRDCRAGHSKRRVAAPDLHVSPIFIIFMPLLTAPLRGA
jgi:hypothetical protein